MSERELVFVKLGGSLITDKSRPYTALGDRIARLCGEIAEARSERPLAVLLGHGGGSFPHVTASRHRTAEGIADERGWDGFVQVHEDATRLNRIVCAALGAAGIRAFPVPPSAAGVASGRRIVRWDARVLRLLLAADLVPVVHGDVLLDETQGCCIASTEELFRHLAAELEPTRVVLAGKVDGVLDERGDVVPAISRDDLGRLRRCLGGSDGIADVTGGMLDKVERALEMGVPVRIVSGLVPGRLRDALLGREAPGTLLA